MFLEKCYLPTYYNTKNKINNFIGISKKPHLVI